MSMPNGERSSGRPVWMFMVATAMATTVSTLTATAMVETNTAEALEVTCACEAAEPAQCDTAPAQTPAAPEAVPAAAPAPAATPAPAPAATPVSMNVEGSLDKDIIRRIVRAHIGEVRYCYNEGLSEDPELSGRVVIEFDVGEDGTVVESKVASTDLEDDDVPECIAEAAARWRFPRLEGGETTTITYPFVLEPG